MEDKFKFGIRSKITVGYIIIILCLFASVIILNSQIRSLQQERNDLIKYNTEVETFTNNVEKYVMDMQAGQRGFVITGNDSYLEPYYKAAEEWQVEFDQLFDLLEDKPKQQEKLVEVKGTIDLWIAEAGERAIDFKRQNNEQGIQQFYANDRGREYMQSIRSQFNDFREYERNDAQTRAQELDDRNNMLTIGLFGLLVIVSAIAIAMASQVSKSIVRTVKDVTETIKKIASENGDRKERIHVTTNDEIKDLAIATNELLDNLDDREWLQTSLAEIVTKYQGVGSIDKLASVFMSEISKMTNSSYGAFYVRETNNQEVHFIKKAAFADSNSQNEIGRESFRLGQGLIGQCALEKNVFVFNEIPKDYRYISTGLGEVPPRSIFIVPILFEDEVIAVVELATMSEYSKLQQDLVTQIVETFGLSINSVMGRMEIVRLLNESRAMTEELQAQSEELQTQSEELQTQSEELQMQTEELTQINEQLEERTKDAEAKSEELEKISLELEEKAEQLTIHSNYKSEFLANMSHELRTPLNSILILSEMLSENGKGNLSEDEAEFAKVIHSSGEDLLSLINDILDLSKVEAGKLEVLFEEVNLSELPVQMEHIFSPVAQKKNLDFRISKAENVPDIFFTDEKRFQQIIKNLLSNAIKFTEKGSVALTIKQLDSNLQTEQMLDISKEWIEISIADTGIGIPTDKHDLIFESFQQADGATVRKYGGTGLGLSICREFAKLLGGWITLQSQEGMGSTFTLVVPSLPKGPILEQIDLSFGEVASTQAKVEEIQEVREEQENSTLEEQEQKIKEQEEKFEALPEDANVFSNKNILIVDDDYRNIYALKTALERRGINILVAKDGLECLDIVQSNAEIDVVLMDIMMPNMDGYETMSKIRNEMNMTELPIIALTAKAMKNDRDKCLEAGASDYISKPLNLDQLFSVLRVWLAS
ncbi:response regulator [Psychrobacillus sp. AK 1817]|uniref:CHASE3 domain-containing protein n=1 Tax=Psychrobacillus sp. AK 1817 TaxID=2303505 RepID=UPI001243A4F7|nr:CHASE3 domain-containing protein [Psychrobacillus sp. AK 1817]QEY22147.1 response regulator [Psychrobacillus sp. AK 1817]